MRRYAAALVYLLLSSLLAGMAWTAAPSRAHACSCAQPGAPDESLRRAAAVFAGEATDIREPSGWIRASLEPVRVAFRVNEIWKGVKGGEAVVRTASAEASCGYEFESGRNYLVYAESGPDGLTASLCSRTTELASAEADLAALGPGFVPVPVKPSGTGFDERTAAIAGDRKSVV